MKPAQSLSGTIKVDSRFRGKDVSQGLYVVSLIGVRKAKEATQGLYGWSITGGGKATK